MNRLMKQLLLVLTLLSLIACSSKQAQTKKYYRINSSIIDTSTHVKPITLVVKRPTALSILGGRPMVATKEDQSLVQLSNNFWLESPKVLLSDIIKDWAQSHWHKVSAQVPSEQPYQTLYTRILAFEKSQQNSLVALEFSLYDENNALIFSQTYKHSEPLSEPGFKAFAQAIGRSVDTILRQFTAEL